MRSRVQQLTLIVTVAAYLLDPTVSCGRTETTPVSGERAWLVMGTLARAQVWAPVGADCDAALAAAHEDLARLDSLLSTWREDSAISRVNRAGGGWKTAPRDLIEALKLGLDVARRSGGAFDPTVLPLVKLWGFRSEPPDSIPSLEAIARCLTVVDHRLVEVDADEGKIRLAHPDMALDLGGVAKGYALDQAAEAMLRAGALGGILDLGGNLLAFGQGPGRLATIVDPRDGVTILAEVELGHGAVATAGQYENRIRIDGRQYGHILDPRTGWPVSGILSATVTAPTAGLADVLATAAFVLGAHEGRDLVQQYAGCEGVFVSGDGVGGIQVLVSAGLREIE